MGSNPATPTSSPTITPVAGPPSQPEETSALKSTVETLSPTRVRLAVEVPFDELKPSLDKAYASIAKQVRVPGFRPGKAPARIIDQRVGRAAVLEEAVQDALPAGVLRGGPGQRVRALGQPEIELTKLEDGETLAFTAEVDVRPEVTLPDYDRLEVIVDDAEVRRGRRRGAGRRRCASGSPCSRPTDRPVQDGDYVSIDLQATVDGEEVPGGSTTGLSYEVGSGLDDGAAWTRRWSARPPGTTASSPPSWSAASSPAGPPTSRSPSARSRRRNCPSWTTSSPRPRASSTRSTSCGRTCASGSSRVKVLEQGAQARDKVLEALLDDDRGAAAGVGRARRGRVAPARHRPPARERRPRPGRLPLRRGPDQGGVRRRGPGATPRPR